MVISDGQPVAVAVAHRDLDARARRRAVGDLGEASAQPRSPASTARIPVSGWPAGVLARSRRPAAHRLADWYSTRPLRSTTDDDVGAVLDERLEALLAGAQLGGALAPGPPGGGPAAGSRAG